MMRGADGPPEARAPPPTAAPNGPRALPSRAPRRTSSGEAVALVQQEMSNLKALKRLSIGNVLSPLDPDLPAFVDTEQHRDWTESDRVLRIPEKSLHRSASTPERSERQRPQMHRQLSASERSAEPSADADMLWVPAHVHPEIAPNEWRSFVENKVEEIKHTMSGPARSGEPAAGSRLSHEIADQADYMDASEMLEKKRRSSSGDKRRSILEMSTQLKSLGELESLASLSGEASEERSWQPPSHGALLRRSGGSSRRRNRPELRRPSSPTVAHHQHAPEAYAHDAHERDTFDRDAYARDPYAHDVHGHDHELQNVQPSQAPRRTASGSDHAGTPEIISPTDPRSVLNLTPRQRVRHEHPEQREHATASQEHMPERTQETHAPAPVEPLHYSRQPPPVSMERRTAPLPAVPQTAPQALPSHRTRPLRTDKSQPELPQEHRQESREHEETGHLRHDRLRHGRSQPQPGQPHSGQPQASGPSRPGHHGQSVPQQGQPPQVQPQQGHYHQGQPHQGLPQHGRSQQAPSAQPQPQQGQNAAGPSAHLNHPPVERKQRPINLNIDVGPNPYRLDSNAPSPGPASAPLPVTSPVSPSGAPPSVTPPASATVSSTKTSPPEPKEERRRWRWLKDGKEPKEGRDKDPKDKESKDNKDKDKDKDRESPASPTAQMFSNLFKKKKKEPEKEKEKDKEPVTWAQQKHHTVVTQGRPGHMRQRSRAANIPQDSKYEPHAAQHAPASSQVVPQQQARSVVKAKHDSRRRPERRGRSRTREDGRDASRGDNGRGSGAGNGAVAGAASGAGDGKIQLPYAIPAHQISDRSQVMMYHRFPLHIERAIYRLSHMKLANPRRPLHQQVLLSNFMYAYLNLINQGYQRQMEGAEEGVEEPLAIEAYDSENNMSDDDMAQVEYGEPMHGYDHDSDSTGFDFYRAGSSSSSSEDDELNEEIDELWDEQHSEFDTTVRVSINGH